MPNIADVLKAEIARLARKEVKREIEGFRKAVSASRTELTSLRKRVTELESALKRANRAAVSKPQPATTPEQASLVEGGLRFRAAGMASNRKRLGLSAAEFGSLVGASAPSIYAWESGKAKPSATSLAAIASLRGLGKREIKARLAALK